MDYTIDSDFLGDAIAKELDAAESWMDADLASEISRNIKYYNGEQFGNEEEGFSNVVSRDVLETVEGIMPELMKLFASADQVVEFDPAFPGDEEQVEIEGRYINHVFMHRENGYKALYEWFKDALLCKNGYIKVGWEENEEVQFREYSGITKEEFKLLESGEEMAGELYATEYEVDDYEEEEDGSYRVRLKISRMRGRPVVDVIPPEEFRIKERSTCIKDAPFVAHVQTMTKGELIEMGFDEDDLDSAIQHELQTDEIRDARFRNPDETSNPGGLDASFEYDKEVEFAEAYIRVFCPEEERVKLYKCSQVGKSCLDYQEVDRVPYISLSPIMTPHRHVGVAVADLVTDIQEIRSTIYRQMLDNLALQNAGRYTAVEGQVNLQDLIDNRIGGIIRQKMPGAVGRLDTPDLSQYTIPMLEQLDLQKENRSGVSRMTAGLDESALSSHQTATAVNAVMTAAQGKILLIARNFAETGVKELFLELYNLIREYQTKPDLVPISGRYAIVNPSEWIDRHDIRVTVGIGNGNKDAQLLHLQGIMQMLQQVSAAGYGYLITPENIFNMSSEFIKNSGYDNPVKFITNPANVEPPQPAPDPNLIKAETDKMFKQGTLELEGKKLGFDGQKFDWQKKVEAAEATLEAVQKRPVGLGDGK